MPAGKDQTVDKRSGRHVRHPNQVFEEAWGYLRDEKQKSTIITSNRPIEDWGLLLKDNAASSAILDRLLHHGHLLKFERKSYRLKEAAKRLSQKKNQD